MNTTVKSVSQTSLILGLLNFLGISLLAGVSSAIFLAAIVLLVSAG